MKLFIFLVFALTVFARESLLSSVIQDVLEERLSREERLSGQHKSWTTTNVCVGKNAASHFRNGGAGQNWLKFKTVKDDGPGTLGCASGGKNTCLKRILTQFYPGDDCNNGKKCSNDKCCASCKVECGPYTSCYFETKSAWTQAVKCDQSKCKVPPYGSDETQACRMIDRNHRRACPKVGGNANRKA